VSSDSDPNRIRTFQSLKHRYDKNRQFDADASWRDWFRHRYLKYWYGLGSLFLDGMLVGIVIESTDPSQSWPYALSAVLVVGLLYLEFRGYMHFWPPKSPS
jgi:hypothetical protein